MATEKQANQAREKHADQLVTLGAHAISVNQIEHQGKKTFAVTAYVEKKKVKMPATLTIKQGKNTLQVPLIVKEQEKFKLE